MLIECKTCKRPISSSARACPGCGEPVSEVLSIEVGAAQSLPAEPFNRKGESPSQPGQLPVRQEVAIWALGLLLAAVSAYNGSEEHDWIFSTFIPILFIGGLVVMSLRDRRVAAAPSIATVGKVLGAVLVGSVFAHVRGEVVLLGRTTDSVHDEVLTTQHDLDRLEAGAVTLTLELDLLRSDLETLQSDVRSLE